MQIQGIHHITLVCADAQRTAGFYRDVLGLRLVKKTVNFDTPTTYHLYFGDDTGAPGTLITFFEWPDAPRGHVGIGGTHRLALTVESTNAQLKWKRYLQARDIAVEGPYDRGYFYSIYFRDPDGCRLEIATRWPGLAADEEEDALGQTVQLPPPELTAAGRDDGAIGDQIWPEPVPKVQEDMRLGGLHHISAICSNIERTAAFYTGILGLPVVKKTVNYDDPAVPHWYFGAPGGEPGTLITYYEYSPEQMRPARMGHGQTHHFALCVADEGEQAEWRDRLVTAGLEVTPVLDRKYFCSIYFHDPDGHILEIATRGPGFLVDEPAETLGESLTLPPWLEQERATIAEGLRPLT
ncbi:MAG TPA: VOC family protein [Chloroflexia bacterium]|nr:VOC family protein [Chloroflexia bacterium]